MADSLRFHLDEHIGDGISRGLRAAGIDVTTTGDAGLKSSSDKVQISFATKQARVFVTDDADFLRLAATGFQHAGIVFCHLKTRTIADIVRTLIRLHETKTRREIKNRIVHVQRSNQR